MSETKYCSYCASSNITPVYATDGVTIRYYRCNECNRIFKTPIIAALKATESGV